MAECSALDTCTSKKSRQYSGLGVHTIIYQDMCVNGPLSEAISNLPCDRWLHRTYAIQHDFDASMGDVWMHQDGQIKDQMTQIKEDRGLYDVRSCLLFTRDVDASGASDPHRTDEK